MRCAASSLYSCGGWYSTCVPYVSCDMSYALSFVRQQQTPSNLLQSSLRPLFLHHRLGREVCLGIKYFMIDVSFLQNSRLTTSEAQPTWRLEATVEAALPLLSHHRQYLRQLYPSGLALSWHFGRAAI